MRSTDMGEKHSLTSSLGERLRDAGLESPQISLTASEALSRLYEAVEKRSAPDYIVGFAVEASRHGLPAKWRLDELKAVQMVIEQIGQTIENATRFEAAELVLSLACLASFDSSTRKRASELVSLAVLSGAIDYCWTESIPIDGKQRSLIAKGIDSELVAHSVLAERTRRNQERLLGEHAEQARLREIERSLKETIHYFQTRIASALGELLKSAVCVEIRPRNLTQTDLQLLLCWSNQHSKPNECVDFGFVRRLLKPFEFARLASARSAELAAFQYFAQLRLEVTDVSVTQLLLADENWKSHDLSVNRCAVDIKNARQSFADRSRYSEYMIPQFKKDRELRRHVAVGAVFSRYLTADQIEGGASAECTFLGMVTMQDLDDLEAWLNTTFEDVLEVGYLSRGGRLPGWCFEYGREHYPSREAGRNEASSLVTDLQVPRDLAAHVNLPLCLAVFSEDESSVVQLLRDGAVSDAVFTERKEMWQQLSSMRSTIGLSRRSLFAFAIAYTLKKLGTSQSEWSPEYLYEWLFFSRSSAHRQRPLGLEDPLGYVAGIVDAMNTLWATSRTNLPRFRRFRMSSPWIIKGIDASGEEHTVMAYCGGSITHPDGTFMSKCGSSPLVIGMDQSCQACKRLVCHVCRFCSDGCKGPEIARVQRKVLDDLPRI